MNTLTTTSKDLNKDTILFNRYEERGKMAHDKSILRRYANYLFILSVILSIALLSVKFGPRYFYRYFGYLWLDKFDSRLTAPQISTIQKGIQGLKAKIVWSSSRTGNHEIFLLTLPDLQMYQITRNNHADFFPRFSPDGEKFVFSRSQRPWVSQRDLDSWDLVLFTLAGNKETILARSAYNPQWITNSRISFVRNRKVMVLDLGTGREEMVLDGNQDPVSGEISTPEFLRQDPNLLAFTGRGKMDGVFIMDRARKTFLKIGQGCQITWMPNGQEVIWVDNGGNGGNQILKSSLTPGQQKVFMDLPGQYSHEYFPRLSPDGKWLVWGASAGGHEHDIADYEIFLWKVGTPFSQAIRLTYNAANDNWPDIFLQN
jgi:Tol biopolymer transport system component